MKPSLKKIVLCADDYGLSGGVCDAIEELVVAARLSATSAMTGIPAWRRRGEGFRSLVKAHPCDVGLHLTLTGQRSITKAHGISKDGMLPSIGQLTRQAFTGTLPLPAVRDELRAQLDAFEDVWGGPPDYVDGHQHAHLLPAIRRAVIEEIELRYPPGSVWLRSCTEPVAAAFQRRVGLSKALTIGAFGLGLSASAARRGIPSNDSFRGLYDFSDRVPYREIFRASLQGTGERILMHCHPGRVDDELRAIDPLLEPRERELAYLASNECGEDLLASGVTPSRFRDIGT